jgi:hypothetical protein
MAMRDPAHVPTPCSPAFRLFLALAVAAAVAGWSALRLGGLHGVWPVLGTASAAGVAGLLAWRLAGRFLLLFVVGMAPALVVLALLSHWLP